MRKERITMRSKDINVQLNVATVASSLESRFGVQRSEALNLIASWAGVGDFGALKASQSKSSSDTCRTTKATADQALYAFLKFTVRNGEHEEWHSQYFSRVQPGDTRTKEQFLDDINQYALFFYDNLNDYIDEHFAEEVERLQKQEGEDWSAPYQTLKPQAIQRALSDLNEGDGHFNRGGDLSIEDVSIHLLSEEDYDLAMKAKEMERRVTSGY